jgi:hypothetical protein
MAIRHSRRRSKYAVHQISADTSMEMNVGHFSPTTQMSPEAGWNLVLDRLRQSIGDKAFKTWFSEVEFGELSAGKVYLYAPTRFVRDWVGRHYGERLLDYWRAVTPDVKSVEVNTIRRAASAQELLQPIVSVPQTDDADILAFAAKTKITGFGNAIVIQTGSLQSGEQATNMWAVVDALHLSHVLDSVIADPSLQALQSQSLYEPLSDRVAENAVRIGHARETNKGLGSALKFFVLNSGQESVKPIQTSPKQRSTSILDEFAFALSELAHSERPTPTSRYALKARAITAVERLIDRVDEGSVLRALTAPDNVSALIGFLASPEVAGVLAQESRNPLAAALARGVAHRKELLEMDGGTASGQEFADTLGITRQAIDKRRKAGGLLAIPNGSGDWRYPWWQLQDHQVLHGLDQVLATLKSFSSWTQFAFFLTPDERLGSRRPLDLLRDGDLDAAISFAKNYGEQGAR